MYCTWFPIKKDTETLFGCFYICYQNILVYFTLIFELCRNMRKRTDIEIVPQGCLKDINRAIIK